MSNPYDDAYLDAGDYRSLPEQMADSIKTCSGTYPHRGVTFWLLPNTNEYKAIVKRPGGAQDMRARQKNFVAGFDDSSGHHWCGLCYFQERCMTLGAKRAFLSMGLIYALPQTMDVAGHEAWFRLLSTDETVLAGSLYRILARL